MLDATKGKTLVVAVVDLLRHDGVYLLTKSSAKTLLFSSYNLLLVLMQG